MVSLSQTTPIQKAITIKYITTVIQTLKFQVIQISASGPQEKKLFIQCIKQKDNTKEYNGICNILYTQNSVFDHSDMRRQMRGGTISNCTQIRPQENMINNFDFHNGE